MLEFHISWGSTDANANIFNQFRSLNDDWTAACFWQKGMENSVPPYVKFQRKSGTSENIFISGRFYINKPFILYKGLRGEKPLNDQSFSEFMESGSSNVTVNVTLPLNNNERYGLGCNVKISSIFEKFATILDDRECKKCGHLKSLVKLSNEFEILLDSASTCFSDVTLKCDNASIPAHKNILSARSVVFAAMFKKPMKENRNNEVVVEDIDVSTLRTMLAFLYTGKASNLTVDSASTLLLAADKYQLLDLKRVCCDFLKDNTSIENVLRILVLGELHSDDLKSGTIDFICKNCKNISILTESEEWTILKKDRPFLVIYVLESIVKSRDVKI